MRKLPALFSGSSVIITTNMFSTILRLFSLITSSSSRAGIFNHDCTEQNLGRGEGGLRVKTKLLLSFSDGHDATREKNHSIHTRSVRDLYYIAHASNLAGQQVILRSFVIFFMKCLYHDRLLPDILTFNNHILISL